jgi:aspartate/methionine/tyrosine aminotransferase
VMPDGAFYVYADISQVAHQASADSSAFSMAVLRDAHVAIVPGDDFGFAAPARHVRFSYATEYSRIEQALERMARIVRR